MRSEIDSFTVEIAEEKKWAQRMKAEFEMEVEALKKELEELKGKLLNVMNGFSCSKCGHVMVKK